MSVISYVYKDGKLLIVQKYVHIGSQVDFMLKPALYFGVVIGISIPGKGLHFT